MAKSKTIRSEQIERARKLLQDLPEKDDRKTREEAAELLEKDFRKVLKRGYTPKELSAMLKNAGIIIPAYLVEKFLKPETEASYPKTEAKATPKPTPKSASKPAPAKEPETTATEGEFIVTPDTPLEDL
jgi:hypothetical protein